MDQQKIGHLLKTLRKEKSLTQEMLADILHVSNRTVSRWETGSNMPDISLLVELSEFYQISIPEIIDGERNGEKLNQETKDTAMKMAEYSKHESNMEKMKTVNILLILFGIFMIISALAIFPNESSWGSIYAMIGSFVFSIGIYIKTKTLMLKRTIQLWTVVGTLITLFGIFTVLDYVAVSQFHQVPRFSYEKAYGEDIVEHKTLFYTVIQKYPGTLQESIEIAK